MFKRNDTKPKKITLIDWVNKTLDQALTRKNIMSRFKGIGIWPLNFKTMDAKIGPGTIYSLQNQAREEEESEQEDGQHEWTKHTTIKNIMNIGSTSEMIIVGLFENQPKYYVNMLRIPIVINHASKNMVENLEQPSMDVEFKKS